MLADVGRYSVREILIERGILSEGEIAEIEKFKNETGWSFAKICLTLGFVSRKKWAELFKELGYEIIDIKKEKVDVKTLSYLNMLVMEQYLGVPLRKENGEVIVAMCDPTDVEFIELVKKIFKMEVKVIFAIDVDIVWVLHKYLGPPFCRIAIYNLLWNDPDRSAVLTFTPRQIAVILAFITFYLAFFSFNPTQAIILINIIIGLIYLLTILFKFTLTIVGSKYEIQETVTEEELKKLSDDELPVYTILLPVYKEPKVIKKLVENISRLDYPRFKLDVKLLLEEDDFETINAIREIDFPAIFEPLVVPYGEPKTKPKACDYGLLFARGKYLTIYDAEDIPEVDQLKKVVALFKKLPDDYICIQCALNYYNAEENLLTRMFTLEYSYWFDYMLPGLDRLGLPIPLGGTSNHFKKDKLEELAGWDPFNVTEDADLGLRAYAKGYKVAILTSTTYEEANKAIKNWIRQRSRWIKGYMQSYLVHMRHPIEFIRKAGLKGFLGLQLFIGGTPFKFLTNPILWAVFIIWLLTKSEIIKEFFPDWVMYISIFNLLFGNGIVIYMNMMSVFRRKLYTLLPFALLNPIYWILHSIAAYKALWQLISNPFYWEKTEHGISEFLKIEHKPK
jgi:cellulose synthase/poly-beta-1,6-N-acetylglucosamine synthase-like glycosyltransferase